MFCEYFVEISFDQPNSQHDTAHAPFAIIAGSQIKIWFTSDAPGVAVVGVGVLQMPK